MTKQELTRAYARHYNRTLAVMFDAARCPVEARAQGMWIYDDEGRSYLDFSAGYGVSSVGNLDGGVQAAVQRQLATLASVPAGVRTTSVAGLIRSLVGLLPADLRRVLFAGSGSEAIEIALRCALLARPGRRGLVAAVNGYHGKTVGALSVMGQPRLRSPFEPVWPDARFVPYGDGEALAAAVDSDVAAVVLEPVLGGGHLTAPPDGYLAGAAEACAKRGALLIVDEVQTGFGRTGRMFGADHDGVTGDIVVLSKAITGGHAPMAAVVMREEVVQEIFAALDGKPFPYGSDSSPSPLACAAATAAIDVIVARDLPGRARDVGAYLLGGLHHVAVDHPKLVLGAPGRGLMAGLKMRNPALESALWMQLLRRNVLTGLSTNWAGPAPVLRFFPPLIVGYAEVDVALTALRDALAELERKPAIVYEVTSSMMRFQHRLPRPVRRGGARFLAGRGRPSSTQRVVRPPAAVDADRATRP